MKRMHSFRLKVLVSTLGLLALLGASHVSAQRLTHASTNAIAVPIADSAHAGHRYHGQRLHRVVRHGVYYYAPRAVPNAHWRDEFDDLDDEDDEFDSADSNSDGYLSLSEARRANSQWSRDFRRIDTSGDGYLTREEIDEFYRR